MTSNGRFFRSVILKIQEFRRISESNEAQHLFLAQPLIYCVVSVAF